MRNLTDEIAAEIALGVVRDHLRAGVEYTDIAEAVDDSWDPDTEGAADEDYQAVASHVSTLMNRLQEQLD
jgi:hypothetical protein